MPEATFDYDLRTGESTFLQQNQYVLQPNTQNSRSLVERSESRPPNTNCVWRDLSSLYVCKQAIVTSSDGVHVPLTIFHSRNVVKEGTSPALLLGYGAYGQILETEWCSDRLSLLDRGWVLAFAHVRWGLMAKNRTLIHNPHFILGSHFVQYFQVLFCSRRLL